jgi:hypothetical protein
MAVSAPRPQEAYFNPIDRRDRAPLSNWTRRFHRIYGAAPYLAKGDLICFLDEDNWMDEIHVESLVDVLRKGHQWAFSLRKIVDQQGKFICLDNCESLGKWPSILSPDDYLLDVNCFMLSKQLAVDLSPIAIGGFANLVSLKSTACWSGC